MPVRGQHLDRPRKKRSIERPRLLMGIDDQDLHVSPQFTGLKLSVAVSARMICSFWFEKRTPGPKLIGAITPVSTFLVFSISVMVQAQVGCLPQRSIAAISTFAAA